MIDDEILGHIFQHSITDLEQFQQQLVAAPNSSNPESTATAQPTTTPLSPPGERGQGEGATTYYSPLTHSALTKPTPSRRKKEAPSTTPASAPRYIVAEPLQPTLPDRSDP